MTLPDAAAIWQNSEVLFTLPYRSAMARTNERDRRTNARPTQPEKTPLVPERGSEPVDIDSRRRHGRRYDWARILELHALNRSTREIAADVGCTTRTVERVRRHADLTNQERGARGRPVSADRLERAKALLEDGASVEEVCRTLGMDHDTIRRHLPGYSWSRAQAAEIAVAARRLARIDPRNALRSRNVAA